VCVAARLQDQAVHELLGVDAPYLFADTLGDHYHVPLEFGVKQQLDVFACSRERALRDPCDNGGILECWKHLKLVVLPGADILLVLEHDARDPVHDHLPEDGVDLFKLTLLQAQLGDGLFHCPCYLDSSRAIRARDGLIPVIAQAGDLRVRQGVGDAEFPEANSEGRCPDIAVDFLANVLERLLAPLGFDHDPAVRLKCELRDGRV